MADPKNLSALASGGSYAGVDQGIDITGGPFDIRALGAGIVTRLYPSGSGWPGEGALVTYSITSGPLKGKNIYVAEDFLPSDKLSVGSKLTAGEIIGRASGSGKAPGIESGFADAAGRAFGSPTGGPQPMGYSFLQAVENLSGDSHAAAQAGFDAQTKVQEGQGDGMGFSGSAAKANAQQIPGAKQVEAVAGGVASAGDAVKFLFSYRGLEVIAGFVLIVIGLVSLAKEAGVDVPLPKAVPVPV